MTRNEILETAIKRAKDLMGFAQEDAELMERCGDMFRIANTLLLDITIQALTAFVLEAGALLRSNVQKKMNS